MHCIYNLSVGKKFYWDWAQYFCLFFPVFFLAKVYKQRQNEPGESECFPMIAQKQPTAKSVQEDNFENKIVLATKISQNYPLRRSYFTLQVL